MPPTDEELRELQISYLDSTAESIGVLRGHVESLPNSGQFKTSFPVLLYLAHQLKGSGGTLGFPAISDIADELASDLESFLDDTEARPDPQELAVRAQDAVDRLEVLVDELRNDMSAATA